METTRRYTKNLETGKIELRFDKSDYMAMSESDKKQIKSNFLFSSYAGAWVSRAKNNTYWAEDVCKKVGAIYEGEEGETLSFEEKVAKTQEKAANRAERFVELSEKAEKESDANYEASKNILSFIPLGQPILVGHHSEGRHRRDLSRADNSMRKSVEAGKKAEYYTGRAFNAEYTASGAQFKSPKYLGNRIKECESALNKLTKNKELYPSENNRWDRRIAEETDKLNFYKGKLLECGVIIHTKESLKELRCTHVLYGKTWYPVKSFNAKSVTILNWLDIAGWTWNVMYTKISGIKTVEDMYVVYDRDNNEVKPTVKHN